MLLLNKTPQILVAEEALLEIYQNFGEQGQLGLRNFPNGLSSLTLDQQQNLSRSARQFMAATVEALDTFDKLLAKYEFWKFLRITSWVLGS